MKKTLALLLVIMMMLPFAACSTGATETPAPAAAATEAPAAEAATEAPVAEGPALSADGRYPAETIKIGFVNYDTSAEQVLAIQKYFTYLQTAFNFEIIWSESIDSAEGEYAFIEQCAAAGCKGIIGYYNIGKEESVKLASSLGMYYWGQAGGADETYAAVADDPYYLGAFFTDTDPNYAWGYAIGQSLIDAGCKNLIVMSGGKDYGVDFFVKRYNGIMDAIKAAQDAGNDVKVVYEVPGWPGTEEFAAHQTAALATNADGLAGTLTCLMWLQPMQVAGKMGQIKFGDIGAVSADLVDLMGGGIYVCQCAEVTDVFGMAIPMIINAVEGYGAQQRTAEGKAARVDYGSWIIKTPDDMAYYASIESETGTWAVDINDVKTILAAYNPGFTVDTMSALYTAVSAAEIQARHTAE